LPSSGKEKGGEGAVFQRIPMGGSEKNLSTYLKLRLSSSITGNMRRKKKA